MSKIIKVIIGLVLTCMVVAVIIMQSERNQVNEDYTSKPMLIFKNKERLWQVVTFEGDAVTALAVSIKPVFKQYYRKVYLNHRSQFVFSDGEPILIMEEPIFWNRAGDIVTYDLRKVSESLVFYVNEKGMKPNTAMTLYELKQDVMSKLMQELNKPRMEDINIDPRKALESIAE